MYVGHREPLIVENRSRVPPPLAVQTSGAVSSSAAIAEAWVQSVTTISKYEKLRLPTHKGLCTSESAFSALTRADKNTLFFKSQTLHTRLPTIQNVLSQISNISSVI